MARPPFIRSKEFPYHVTARTNNKETFHAPLDKVWKIATRTLSANSIKHRALVEAFVLMPNHFHLIILTPEGNLDLMMRDWLREFTFKVNAVSKRSGRLFGARYFRSLVDETEYLNNVFRYVYRNPVKAGLVKRVEDYAYSTVIRDLILESKPEYFICKTLINELNETQRNFLNWINTSASKQENELIREGLKKQVFKSKKDRQTRHELLDPYKYEQKS